jgi:hypothetical protein
MEFDLTLPVSLGSIVALVAVGTLGLMQGDMMSDDTVLMMVLPSMLVFAAVVFVIGVKHGEYRAANA